jgi:hypothetical protein
MAPGFKSRFAAIGSFMSSPLCRNGHRRGGIVPADKIPAMRGQRIVLWSPLDVTEARRRVEHNSIVCGRFMQSYALRDWGRTGVASMMGESGGEIELWIRRFWWKNDYSPHFIGRLIPETRGCRIEGKLDTGTYAQWGAWVGVIASSVFAVLFVVQLVQSGRVDPTFLWAMAAVVVASLVAPRFLYLVSEGDESTLIRFLEDVCHAELVEHGAPIEPS